MAGECAPSAGPRADDVREFPTPTSSDHEARDSDMEVVDVENGLLSAYIRINILSKVFCWSYECDGYFLPVATQMKASRCLQNL